MVLEPRFQPPGRASGATVAAVVTAIRVAGKVTCPEHRQARVTPVSTGMYRCKRGHDLHPPGSNAAAAPDQG